MKVERHVETQEEERARTPRPKGSRISWSQLNTPCDLRLKFRRARIKVKNPFSIGLVYGRALHAGVEAYLRGAAKTPADAIKAGQAALTAEIRKTEKDPGLRWDDWHQRNLDGSIAMVSGNFGSLPDVSFARWWLERQLAVWLAVYGRSKVRFSEKSIYVPLTRQPRWADDWSVECWLDFVLDAPKGGYQVTDIKTTADRWRDLDVQKGANQAHLYMGAANNEFGEPPELPFEFQVLPRTKTAVPALELALAWSKGELGAAEPLGIENLLRAGGPPKMKTVTVGTGKKAVKTEEPVLDTDGNPVQEWTLADAIQIVPVPFDLERINTYIRGVIRPRISMIEADAFAANPSGWWCSETFCDFFSVCAFGKGTLL